MLEGPIMSAGGYPSSQTGPPTMLEGAPDRCFGVTDKPGGPKQVWVPPAIPEKYLSQS